MSGDGAHTVVDIARAIKHVDLLDHTQILEGLAALTLTSGEMRRVFDELFDLYFPPRWYTIGCDTPGAPLGGAAHAEPDDADHLIDEILDALGCGRS